jgi:NitT/TauT family transport system ATP-binding protein
MKADLRDRLACATPEVRSDSGCTPLRIGFIPLVDCATLVVAEEKGFAAAEGLVLDLQRETSWANIRDRLVLGHFDAAHMLGPVPIAANLGISHLDIPMVAPMVLNLGGNAITLSTRLWNAIAGKVDREDPATIGRALAMHVAEGNAAGSSPLAFAMVFPFSGHNYELRYWLAASGIHPDRDVRLVVIPPPFMVDALALGHVDGICVGAPWNALAVAAGAGRIVATKSDLWRQSPEKVLGFRTSFAERNADRVDAMIRALVRAAHWAGNPANHAELAALLAEPRYVNAPAETIARVLAGEVKPAPGEPTMQDPDHIVFDRHAATFPWQSHALWLYSQMVRWGQTSHNPVRAEIARTTYRPDIYRRAVAELDLSLPSASMKVEGALSEPTPVGSRAGDLILGPDGFFDGQHFDPDALDAYIDRFEIHSRSNRAP